MTPPPSISPTVDYLDFIDTNDVGAVIGGSPLCRMDSCRSPLAAIFEAPYCKRRR
jgi:hypothetical protein